MKRDLQPYERNKIREKLILDRKSKKVERRKSNANLSQNSSLKGS